MSSVKHNALQEDFSYSKLKSSGDIIFIPLMLLSIGFRSANNSSNNTECPGCASRSSVFPKFYSTR